LDTHREKGGREEERRQGERERQRVIREKTRREERERIIERERVEATHTHTLDEHAAFLQKRWNHQVVPARLRALVGNTPWLPSPFASWVPGASCTPSAKCIT
jgi:hypothetical protein